MKLQRKKQTSDEDRTKESARKITMIKRKEEEEKVFC